MAIANKTFNQVGLTQAGYPFYDPTLNDGLGGFRTPSTTLPQSDITGLSTALALLMPKSGGTFGGNVAMGAGANLTLAGDATTGTQATTYQQLQAAILTLNAAIMSAIAGFTAKNACYASTIANLSATYNNGSSGVGATLTLNANGIFSTDGVTPPINARICVPAQANAIQNGIYTLTNTGSASSPAVLTRATDYDNSVTGEVFNGTYTNIENGTKMGGTQWYLATTGTIVIGTTPLNFAQSNTLLPGDTSILKPNPNSIIVNQPALVLAMSQITGLTAALASYLPLTGGAMTGAMTLAADAVSALQPVSYQQFNVALAPVVNSSVIVPVTANYTILQADNKKIFNNTSGTNRVLTLSALSGYSSAFSIKVVCSGGGSVKITPTSPSVTSNNISGLPSFTVYSGQSFNFYSDGANWVAESQANLQAYIPISAGDTIAPDYLNNLLYCSYASTSLVVPTETASVFFPINYKTFIFQGGGSVTVTAPGVALSGNAVLTGLTIAMLQKLQTGLWIITQSINPAAVAFTGGAINAISLGATTPSTVNCTALTATSISATSGINSTAIGQTTAAAGKFTTLAATSLDSTPIGQTTPAAAGFTTATTTTDASTSRQIPSFSQVQALIAAAIAPSFLQKTITTLGSGSALVSVSTTIYLTKFGRTVTMTVVTFSGTSASNNPILFPAGSVPTTYMPIADGTLAFQVQDNGVFRQGMIQVTTAGDIKIYNSGNTTGTGISPGQTLNFTGSGTCGMTGCGMTWVSAT